MTVTIDSDQIERERVTGPCPRVGDVPHDCTVSSCDVWAKWTGYVPRVREQGPQTLKDWAWYAADDAARAAGWNLVRAERKALGYDRDHDLSI